MNIRDRKKQQQTRDRQKIMKTLTLITQFGINMLVPIFLCFFAGMWLDKKFGTKFIMIIGFLIGVGDMFLLVAHDHGSCIVGIDMACRLEGDHFV